MSLISLKKEENNAWSQYNFVEYKTGQPKARREERPAPNGATHISASLSSRSCDDCPSEFPGSQWISGDGSVEEYDYH